MKIYVAALILCFAAVSFPQITPESELSDYEKLELKIADLEFQMEELERQIQADSERLEIEKLLINKYTEELEEKEDEYFNGQKGITAGSDYYSQYKNELTAVSGIVLTFDNAEKPLFRTDIKMPAVDYKYESDISDFVRLYFYSGMGYEAVRSVWDGEHRTDPADNLQHRTDTFSNEIYMYIDPKVKLHLTNGLFLKAALPFEYSEFTPQRYEGGKRADSYGVFGLEMVAEFGFDNRIIEKHLLSPWNNFEEGISVLGFFRPGITASVDGESADDLPAYIGMEACYSELLNNDDMIKAYLTHSYQNNEDAGYKNTWITFGALYSRDFSRVINLESDIHITVDEREISDKYDPADPDDDIGTYWYIDASSKIHYYKIPELDAYFGINTGFDLSRGDDQLGNYLGSVNYGLEVGLIYKLKRSR